VAGVVVGSGEALAEFVGQVRLNGRTVLPFASMTPHLPNNAMAEMTGLAATIAARTVSAPRNRPIRLRTGPGQNLLKIDRQLPR
jgi:hypothetical protein